MTNKIFKMPIDQALAGTLQAIQEGTAATDAIVIILNRETGEFKAAGFPYDPNRQISVLEKALGRWKRAKGRDQRFKETLKIN